MTTNTIEKVLAKYGLTIQSPSLNVLILDEIQGGGIGIPVIKLLEEVDEAARAAEQADMAKRNEIHEKYHELNDRDIEIKAHAEGYKQGQIDAVKHLFENKIAMVRAVKVLSEDMQDVAKKAGYKPDDILFITMEKIEGSIVEWQIKNGLVLKKVD